jgi:hypothetical protein
MAAITWTGAAGDGNFNNPANWSPAQVPGATDTVTISPHAATLINISTADAVQALKTSATVTLSISDGSSLTVGNAATKNAALTNAGTITLNNYDYNTSLIIGGPEVTLSGGGTILMGVGGGNLIYGAASTDVLNNTGNLIEGAGQLGDGTLTYINGAGGTVDATDGNYLYLNTGANTVTNAGLLEATAGGGLVIQSSVSNGAAGKISAAGANVYLQSGADIAGGTLTSTGVFAIAVSNTAALDGTKNALTNLGTVAIQDGSTLSLLGSIVNSGLIALEHNDYNTDLVIGPGGTTPGTVTLSGGGTITLADSGNGNRIYGAIAGDTLINAGNTIAGSGQLGTGTLTLINDATIDATGGNALYLNTGATALNNALMEATGPGGLIIQSRVDSSGGGTILAASAAVVLNGGTLAGGLVQTTGTGAVYVSGSGTLDGTAQTVTNDGIISVDDQATLDLLGTITNAGTISLNNNDYYTFLEVASAAATLTGGGTVLLDNGGGNFITASAVGEALVNVNNTIEGAGQLGGGTLTFTNAVAGIVDATVGDQLVLNTGTIATTNMGLLEATTGSGGLVIQTNVNNGTAGRITAAGGNVFLASGADIIGGTLSSTGSAAILDSNSATLGAVGGTITNTGTIALQDGTTLTLLGTILDDKLITLNNYDYSTDLVIGSATTVGTTTLSGGGTISLDQYTGNRIYAALAGDTLLNMNNTISGAGQIGVGSDGLLLVNDGTIAAATGGALTINTGAVVTNNALIEATGGSNLYIDGVINSSGGGTILAASGNVALSGGTLQGGLINSAAGFAVIDVNSATLDGSKKTVTNKGLVSLNDGTTLTLLGTITNNGTISLNNYDFNTDLVVGGSTVTLTGGGTVLLDQYGDNRIYGAVGTDVLVNVNNTIEGAGQIGASQLTLVNQAKGIINADQSGALILTSNAGGTITNAGLMESTSTGGLVVQGVINSSTGGTILANGGNVYLNAGSLEGGVIASGSNGGFFDVDGTFTLDGSAQTLTNNTSVAVNDGQTLTLLGTITNHGTISLNNYDYNTDLIAGSPTVSLTGSGTILLDQYSGNRIYGATASDVLVNVNNVIEGAGQIGVGQLTLVNQAAGIIDADNAGNLLLSASGTVINAGLIESTGTGGLSIQTIVDSSSGGTILAAGGNVYLNGGTLAGGLIESSGTGAFIANGFETLDGSAHTLTSDAVVSMVDGATMTLLGNIANNGTILLNNYDYNTDLIVGSPTVSLSGTGTILLDQYGGNRIYGVTAADVLDNVSNLIEGAGQLGAGQLTLVNAGVINANSSGALIVNLGSTGLNTSTGTMESTSSGGLVFQNGTYTNLGLYEATDGAVLTFQSGATLTNDSASGTLTGGTYTAIDGGHGATISITGAAVSTLAADVVLSGANSTVEFGGTAIDASLSTIGTAGMLSVLGGRNFTVVAAGGTLTDNGVFTLGGGTLNDARLIIGSLGELSGFGTIVGPVSNGGTIDITGGKMLFEGPISGNGTITTGAGGTADFTGGGTLTQPITGTGTLELTAGTFTLAGATVTIGNLLVDAATSLTGTGTVSSQTVDSGTITASGGTLTLAGGASGGGALTANAGALLVVGGGSSLGGALAGAGMIDLTGATTLVSGISLQAKAITQSSTVTLAAGVSVTNMTGDTYILASAGADDRHRAQVQITGGAGSVFTNAGSLAASVTALISVGLDNTGTLSDSNGTLTVSGALSGTGGMAMAHRAQIDLTGGGSYSGAFSGAGTLRFDSQVTLNAGASLSVSNVVDTSTLTLAASEAIKIGGGNTFALADAAGNGSHRAQTEVTGGSGSSFTNAGTVTASAIADSFNLKFTNSGLTMATAGTLSFLAGVSNSGTFDAAGGAISMSKIVTGTGALEINAASTFSLMNGAAAGQTVDFLASSGALDLGNPLAFAGAIDGFAGSDTIDLLKTASTSETFAAGVLTVVDNGATVASLHFTGSYTTGDFMLASDGNGGSLITFI